MTEEALKQLETQVGEVMARKFAEQSDELRNGLLTEDQLKTELEAFAKANDIEEVNKKIDEKIEEVLIEMKKQAEAKENAKPKTLAEQLEAKHEEMKKGIESKAGFSVHLDTKTNVSTGSWSGNTSGTYEMGFNQEAYRGMVFENYFRRFKLDPGTKTIYYSDQTTVTRNAANKDEAAAAPESALGWTQRSLEMGKILDSIPVTHEAMMDILQLVPEIEGFLDTNMRLKIDSNLWNGNGTLPNWKGIYQYATDFTQAIATGAGVDAVQDANIYDLIATIAVYISNGKESKYRPNVVFLNPRDVLKGRMEKDANGNYIMPPFVGRDGMVVDNVTIVPTAAVTANTLALGDGMMARYYDVEGIDLEYGFDADDFSKDLVTLKARKRGNLLVKTIDTVSWYKVTNINQRISDITA